MDLCEITMPSFCKTANTTLFEPSFFINRLILKITANVISACSIQGSQLIYFNFKHADFQHLFSNFKDLQFRTAYQRKMHPLFEFMVYTVNLKSNHVKTYFKHKK